MTYATEIRKAADIAKIDLDAKEAEELVNELSAVLDSFSKIDSYGDNEAKPKTIAQERPLRKDKTIKSAIDPFSNTKLVEERKFKGPRLVD